MIDAHWKRIAAIHVQEGGDISAVWLAIDNLTDTIHLYDACIFQREVLAVIAEGLNARGRWIPIAWKKSDKEMSDKLLERGCNMTYEPCDDSEEVAEMASRDIWERMRSQRFKIDKRLKNWQDEFNTFNREGQKVPLKNYPLMSATRHAINRLDYAKKQITTKSKNRIFPKVAIV